MRPGDKMKDSSAWTRLIPIIVPMVSKCEHQSLAFVAI